jgi:hypothetical protein
MNKREKMLAIVLGLGVFLLMSRLVVSKYRTALSDYDNIISNLKKDLNEIDQEQRMADQAARQWRERIGPQTLAMDEKEAANRLRKELFLLAEKAGLAELNIDLGSTAKSWESNGLKVLSCKLQAEGPLEKILSFLFELHRQPYDVRCKRLNLTQAVHRVHSSRRKTGGEGLLKMTADLDTLILPTNSLVPVFDTADLDTKQRRTVPRTRWELLEDYQALVKRDLFQPYAPPAPKPPPKRASKPEPKKPRPKPERKRPPADARMVLGRTLSSPRGQIAVLEHPGPRGRGREDVYKYVGDEMYGGVLVYVHPRGAVTQQDDGWLFHPLGEALNRGRELDGSEEPIVYHEILKLRDRTKGISEAPG